MGVLNELGQQLASVVLQSTQPLPDTPSPPPLAVRLRAMENRMAQQHEAQQRQRVQPAVIDLSGDDDPGSQAGPSREFERPVLREVETNAGVNAGVAGSRVKYVSGMFRSGAPSQRRQ